MKDWLKNYQSGGNIDPYIKDWFSNPITTNKLKNQFNSGNSSYFTKVANDAIQSLPTTLNQAKIFPINSSLPDISGNGQEEWNEDVNSAKNIAENKGYSRISDSYFGVLKNPNDSVKLSTVLTGISNPMNYLNNKDKDWYPNIMDVRSKLKAIPGVPIKLQDLDKIKNEDSYKYLKNVHGTDNDVLNTLNTVAQNKPNSSNLSFARYGIKLQNHKYQQGGVIDTQNTQFPNTSYSKNWWYLDKMLQKAADKGFTKPELQLIAAKWAAEGGRKISPGKELGLSTNERPLVYNSMDEELHAYGDSLQKILQSKGFDRQKLANESAQNYLSALQSKPKGKVAGKDYYMYNNVNPNYTKLVMNTPEWRYFQGSNLDKYYTKNTGLSNIFKFTPPTAQNSLKYDVSFQQ